MLSLIFHFKCAYFAVAVDLVLFILGPLSIVAFFILVKIVRFWTIDNFYYLFILIVNMISWNLISILTMACDKYSD